MLLLPLLLAALPAVATEALPLAQGRLDKPAALRQVAVHACLTSLPVGAARAAVEACVASFSREIFVADDDGACTRFGVVGERLVLCQGAVADWVRAEGAGDVRAALLAAIRVRGRCLASELCPRGEPKATGFARRAKSRPPAP